jgi:phosphoribosyl-ATP pyrophosphohydrolase/phosphoribosyl-AMP cyclohydrolase
VSLPADPIQAAAAASASPSQDATIENPRAARATPAPGGLPAPEDLLQLLRFDGQGLIPAIAQDWLDGAVLMVAWMNREALRCTLELGEVHYWSRSRQTLWHKGASSGHRQRLKELRYDCDADALLLSVEQLGDVACHTGARSCFYDVSVPASQGGPTALPPPADACTELSRVIERRQRQPEPGSYTNRLLEGGDNRILKKIGEEGAEFVMACKDDDAEAIANEAADLIFHLQVALCAHGVPWRRVQQVLAARRGAPRRDA